MTKRFIRKVRDYICAILILVCFGYIMCLASYWDAQEEFAENYTQEELAIDDFSDLWIF